MTGPISVHTNGVLDDGLVNLAQISFWGIKFKCNGYLLLVYFIKK